MLKRFLLIFSSVICIALASGISYLAYVSYNPGRYEIPIELPWWDYYADYWYQEWEQLTNSLDPKVSGISMDDEHKMCFKWITITHWNIPLGNITWCLRATLDETGKNIGTRLIRLRYGLFGLVVLNRADWIVDDDIKQNVFGQFPNGPSSFIDPKPNWHRLEYQRPLTNSEVVESFLQTTLFLEPDSYGYKEWIRHPLRKWTIPVRMIVDDWDNISVFNQSVTEYTKTFVRKIVQATKLDIKVIQRGEEPGNFIVAIFRKEQRADFLQFAEHIADSAGQLEDYNKDQLRDYIYRDDNSPCFTVSNQINSKLVRKNVFILKANNEIKLRECLEEEIMQGFGVSGDARWLEPSTFNDWSPYNQATELDWVLLSILYDDRLKPGMELDELKPIVAQIIAEYRLSGKLNSLNKRVYLMY